MQKLPGMYKWERALNFSASSKIWQHAACATLRFSRCLSHWETTQKLLHFWYYTPEKLCKMFPSSPCTCWRACGNPGSSAHIWWTCPAISGFWKDVQTLLGVITGVTYRFTPQLALLGVGLEDWPHQLHSIVTHILIVARLSIARKWKSAIPPTIL